MSERPTFFSPRAGSRGMDELQYAAYCGDVDAVRRLLAEGADVRAADDFGWTALHWNVRMACTPGDRVGIAELLIKGGADVNARDGEGFSVLDNALEATAHEPLIRLLRSNGAVANEEAGK